MTRPLHEARIDLEAIRHNVRTVANVHEPRPILAVVAADGYGHGALESARAAIDGGAEQLAVGGVAEGIALLDAGIRAPILTASYLPAADYRIAAAHHIGVTIHSADEFRTAVAAGVQRCHIRAEPDDSPALADEVADLAVSAPSTEVTVEGSLLRLDDALYGIGPAGKMTGLRPAMRVSAQVVATKTITTGDGVSYGYTYRATKPTRLALVSVGYAEGLDRAAGNRATLWLDGKPRLIAGRVAMNVVVLELGDDVVAVGSEAVVFGDPDRGEPTAQQWAASIDAPVAAVVSTVGSRLPRTYSDVGE